MNTPFCPEAQIGQSALAFVCISLSQSTYCTNALILGKIAEHDWNHFSRVLCNIYNYIYIYIYIYISQNGREIRSENLIGGVSVYLFIIIYKVKLFLVFNYPIFQRLDKRRKHNFESLSVNVPNYVAMTNFTDGYNFRHYWSKKFKDQFPVHYLMKLVLSETY